jgi:hypothetical protein
MYVVVIFVIKNQAKSSQNNQSKFLKILATEELNTHLSSSSILKHNSKTYISKDDEEILLRSSLLIGHMSKYKA